jgi:hypothetical protein
MSWLAKSQARFGAATALAAIAVGCGHPPLTAYATPHPIMLGPVRRLHTERQAPGQDANGIESGSFAATASTQVAVTSTPTGNGSVYTDSTEVESLPSALDAAAIEAIEGDARGRLEAREVACSSVVVYMLFYVFWGERCTIVGRTERPRRASPKAPAAAPAPNAAPAVPPVTSPSEPAPAPTDAIDAASE